MSNSVAICSNALLMVGAKSIDSFADGTVDSERCANLYPPVKKAVLRSHPWNCAIKRVVLSPEAEVPAFDWAYQFQLPSDWLKNLQIGLKDAPEDYAPEGRKILMDTNALRLVYIADTDEGEFDSMLTRAMQLSMAAVLAYPVSASTSLRDSFLVELRDYMKQVRAVDGQDSQSEELGSELLLIGSRY